MFGMQVKTIDKKMIDAMRTGAMFNVLTLDAATAGGMAYLQSELEKRDPKVREPLTSVTWMRDIVIKTGGGWVDFTSAFFVDYATGGPNMYGLMGGETTTIPTMQADLSKDIWKVFNWGNVLKVPYIDQAKLQQIGRSLDDLLDKGVRLNWNKTLDLLTYQGFSTYPGLVNNTSITEYAVALNAAGTSRSWVDKTPTEIMYDINYAMVATWAASEYDVTGMANHILIPPAQYAYIANTPVSAAGTVSILTYLLENNIGKTQGVDLAIFPSRWVIGADELTSPASDRMVCYVNDEDRIYMDITVPIQRAMTMPDVKEAAYLTLYLGQVGIPKFLYLEPVVYSDGI